MVTNEEKVRMALGRVLCNVSNYPQDVQARLLGANLSKVIGEAVEAVLGSGAVEQVNGVHERPLVDRVEVIDASGRAYVQMSAVDVSTSLQDRGRTLKIFVGEKL